MLKLFIAFLLTGLLLTSCGSVQPCYKQQNHYHSKTVI
jgi:hypothetical protein